MFVLTHGKLVSHEVGSASACITYLFWIDAVCVYATRALVHWYQRRQWQKYVFNKWLSIFFPHSLAAINLAPTFWIWISIIELENWTPNGEQVSKWFLYHFSMRIIGIYEWSDFVVSHYGWNKLCYNFKKMHNFLFCIVSCCFCELQSHSFESISFLWSLIVNWPT